LALHRASADARLGTQRLPTTEHPKISTFFFEVRKLG
jgi:hypothetical protein